VYVLGPQFAEATYSQVRAFMSRPRRALGGATDMTSVLMTHAAAQRLFGAANVDLAAAATNEAAASRPVALGSLSGTLTSRIARHADDTAPNVVAILRGSDPELANEYVVFSAHMDHVGVGRPDASGDSIYNGADDDASGTAALIEVAEAFSNLLQRPRRSLVFMAVSGEEKGLLGSRWWSDHPTLPLESVVANINVDMIGRNAPDTIVVIGQEYSSLGPTVLAVADEHRAELGLNVAIDPWPEERFFFRSDHFNFARKEIPALFFFAGVHDDYHQPSDEVDLIDGDKSERVARLIFFTAHEIADTPARPQWTEQGIAEIRALTGGGR
jgi:Zn-dependent M28 family amino/carboxypeptidase